MHFVGFTAICRPAVWIIQRPCWPLPSNKPWEVRERERERERELVLPSQGPRAPSSEIFGGAALLWAHSRRQMGAASFQRSKLIEDTDEEKLDRFFRCGFGPVSSSCVAGVHSPRGGCGGCGGAVLPDQFSWGPGHHRVRA